MSKKPKKLVKKLPPRNVVLPFTMLTYPVVIVLQRL